MRVHLEIRPLYSASLKERRLEHIEAESLSAALTKVAAEIADPASEFAKMEALVITVERTG